MKLWGQIDLKPIIVTVISTALISGFGYIWTRVEKVNALELRIGRIENAQENQAKTQIQILDLLKKKR